MSDSMRYILYYENVLEFTEKTGSELPLKELHNMELCRLCLTDSDFAPEGFRVVNLDGHPLGMEEMVFVCTGIKIEADDSLPRLLCKRCVDKLSPLYLFQLQARRAQVVLKQILKRVSSKDTKMKDLQNFPSSSRSSLEQCIYLSDEEASKAGSSSDCVEIGECAEKLHNNPAEKLVNDSVVPVRNELKNENDIVVEIREPIQSNTSQKVEIDDKQDKIEDGDGTKLPQTIVTRNDHISKHTKSSFLPNVRDVTSTNRVNQTFGLTGTEMVKVVYDNHHEKSVATAAKKEQRIQKSSSRILRARRKSKIKEPHRSIHKCTHCSKQFKSEVTLISHSLREHSKCTKCGKTCDSNSLTCHRRHCTSNDKNVCAVCGRNFKTCDELQRHARIHTKQFPYSCDECNKTFTKISSLKEHQRTHRSEMYECAVCNVQFSSRKNFYLHRKSHASQKES